VRLPRPGALGGDELYVPGGWFHSGGDRQATGAPLPGRRIWLDSFAIQRDPVTNAQYIAFLDDLVAAGREGDALRWAPRERGGTRGVTGALVYGRTGDGRFALVPDAEGDLWAPDWPVLMVDWFCASAYAAWWAAQTGLPWRLPGELEWEKAARGVDGRAFPWGDFLDPNWCRMRDSTPDRPLPAAVDAYPADVSPYGVRGMGGNAFEWCHDAFLPGGPPIIDGLAPRPDPGARDAPKVVRGGSWSSAAGRCRVAFRSQGVPETRSALASFRLARPLSE